MTREEILRDLSAHWARHIDTWEDWYRYVDEHTKISLQSGLPPLIVASTCMMYSFMQAMREMPDEGDIKILVGRTARILVMELASRLGLDIRHLLNSSDVTDGQETTADSKSEADAAAQMAAALIRKVQGS